MLFLLLAGLALCAGHAVAHGGLANYTVGDVWYRGIPPPSYIPISAGSNLTAFKIWEAGLWYQKGFQRWDGSPGLWPVRIPRRLKKGRYMVRHEILSIHVEEKPQVYPECAHLEVSGDGEVVVPEEWLVRFPGAYKEDDPSIKINIYSENANRTDYVIPGGRI
ncbi:glycoside hydrolase family 61 protein [Staphylotrichum tortipilum]|uniref:lytic cellulose monooxygenase (C4-dehydrogenating) n=1 Tax=Staphylotrichum tortipilum TaxID=2831512 RepID=A0AAN6MHR3_9PEZI|nr:glycoside hydrolase family 61 protein [Staphylotrichum longicolle]